MQELEKILEEIIEQLKAEGCIIDNDAGHRAVDIIRKHMDNNNLCEKCSRRKWYQIGYKDGKNDGWIPVVERMPEERDSMFATLKGTDKWSKGMFEKISDDVNVTVEYEDGTRKTISAYTLDGQWKLPSRILKQKVIAWCPCPEPYKPKTHDKPPEHWPEWRTKFLGKFDRRM